jgi:hypothetical protein
VGLVVQAPTADLMLASVMGRRWATAVGEKISSRRTGLEARRGEGIEEGSNYVV